MLGFDVYSEQAKDLANKFITMLQKQSCDPVCMLAIAYTMKAMLDAMPPGEDKEKFLLFFGGVVIELRENHL